MTQKNLKMAYTTPWMECIQIETEDCLAGSTIEIAKKESKIEAQAQDYDEIDGSSSFDNIEWK